MSKTVFALMLRSYDGSTKPIGWTDSEAVALEWRNAVPGRTLLSLPAFDPEEELRRNREYYRSCYGCELWCCIVHLSGEEAGLPPPIGSRACRSREQAEAMVAEWNSKTFDPSCAAFGSRAEAVLWPHEPYLHSLNLSSTT